MDLLLLLLKLWIISYSVLVEWPGYYLNYILAVYYLCHKGGWAMYWPPSLAYTGHSWSDIEETVSKEREAAAMTLTV